MQESNVQTHRTTTKVYETIRKLGRPTVKEIADEAGLSSTSVVWYHLEILRAEGHVTWQPGKARTIRLVEDA
jgi:SOS-response transcriptional repressor LexA